MTVGHCVVSPVSGECHRGTFLLREEGVND